MLDKLLKGRYQIVQILTTGRFCQTYLAQDISLPDDHPCIVKHFISPSGEHPDGLTSKQLFTREVETLLKLDKYDWVPQLLAHFEEDQQYYLVQEFIVGHSLSAELQPGQIWTENQVVELLQEVLSILEFLHECGIIHRDINPSNLLRRHQDGRLIVIDFGWVKQLGMQVVTSQGQTYWKFTIGCPATIAIGTQGYMPAEQGQGRPRPNSDIYALGMIGIQALTGLPPTELLADDTGEIIWQPQIRVSPDLENVLTKMVRYHFQDRYQSVIEVMQALQPLVTLLSTSTDSVQLSITATSQNEDQDFKLNTTPVVQGDATKSSLSLKAGAATQLRNRRSNAVPTLAKSALLGITILTSVVLMVGSYYNRRSPVLTPQIQQNPIISSTANISLVKSLNGHSDSVWVVAFSPDGQTLVSGSQDQTIKLWDLDTGKLLRTFTGHTGAIWSVALSNGQLASGSSDNTIKFWDLDTGELLRTFTGHTGAVRSIALSANGQLASGSSDNTVKLWNLNSGRQRTFLGHTNRVLAVALSPDGQILTSGSVDKTLKVWNLSSGKLLHNFSENSHWVNSVAISPDGRIVAGAVGNIIKIWDLHTGELLHTLSGHSSDITSISFSADGKQLASASRDQTIKIWQVSKEIK